MTLNVGSYFRLQADWETSVTRQDLFSALNATSGAAEPPKTDLLRQAQEFYTSEDGLAQLIDVGLTRRFVVPLHALAGRRAPLLAFVILGLTFMLLEPQA